MGLLPHLPFVQINSKILIYVPFSFLYQYYILYNFIISRIYIADPMNTIKNHYLPYILIKIIRLHYPNLMLPGSKVFDNLKELELALVHGAKKKISNEISELKISLLA